LHKLTLYRAALGTILTNSYSNNNEDENEMPAIYCQLKMKCAKKANTGPKLEMDKKSTGKAD